MKFVKREFGVLGPKTNKREFDKNEKFLKKIEKTPRFFKREFGVLGPKTNKQLFTAIADWRVFPPKIPSCIKILFQRASGRKKLRAMAMPAQTQAGRKC